MVIDFTPILVAGLAFYLVVMGVAAVAGYFVLRRVLRGVKAMSASRRTRTLARAGAS